MKNKILIFTVMLFSVFLISSGASAALIWGTPVDSEYWTGARDSYVDPFGGLSADGTYVNGGAFINWTVSYENGLYTYEYEINTPIQALSHFTLEVTNDGEDFVYQTSATSTQIVEGPKNIEEGAFTIYGVKFDYSTNSADNTYTIITNRAPVWGVAYLKDGGGNAWTSALDYLNFMTREDLSFLNFIARPDGTTQEPPDDNPVPEPATLLLLGAGLLGLAGIGRRKLFK